MINTGGHRMDNDTLRRFKHRPRAGMLLETLFIHGMVPGAQTR